MRQEIVNNTLSPFLPSFNIRYEPFFKFENKSNFYLSSNIFRNYRYPTLNDRYWATGGNPDLQQEKGWGAEGKVGYDRSFKKGLKLESSINAYYLDVQNWILWLPESSTGIWTPENVRRVKSRGVEALVKLDGGKGDWTYRFTANYHFNKATNETEGGTQGASSGKLLIYTPQHLGNISGMVGYKGYYLQYRQHLCGQRYITSDNRQSLPAFTTGDVRIGKDFSQKKLKGLSIYISADNLWDAQYQNIAWRPMPGRSYSGGVRYEFAVKMK
jgi:iron complex outermembrane receptor protein